ncbi:MAG: tetratricopeptide repeat protein [Nitrospinota bacterium]
MNRRQRCCLRSIGVAPALLALFLLAWVGQVEGQGPQDPTTARWQKLEEAYRLLDSGRARDAEAYFRAILAEDPKHPGAHEGLVWTYLVLREPEKAAREADARLALAPEDATWLQKWIEVVHQVPARRDEAISASRALADERPRDLKARLLLARILTGTEGRLTEAIAEYRKAVAIAPTDRTARRELARTLSWVGKHAEAIRLFDALISEDPLDAEALSSMAQIARWNGDFERANRFLQRAVTAEPGNARLKAELDGVRSHAARLRAARGGATLPLVFALMGFCILVGYVSHKVSVWTYAALILYTAGLVSMAFVWFYLAPGQ